MWDLYLQHRINDLLLYTTHIPPFDHVISGCGYPSAKQAMAIVLPSIRAVSFGSFIQRGATVCGKKSNYWSTVFSAFHQMNCIKRKDVELPPNRCQDIY